MTEMTQAKLFKLADKDGNVVDISKIKSQFTVLFFYPKDDTPGCTLETKGFSSLLSEFKKRDVTVLGISGGDAASKQKFCDKYELRVQLLSDTDFNVSKLYGVYGEKSFMGRKYMGISRVTFILNKKLEIVRTFEKVTPVGHAQEVLAWIDAQSTEKKRS